MQFEFDERKWSSLPLGVREFISFVAGLSVIALIVMLCIIGAIYVHMVMIPIVLILTLASFGAIAFFRVKEFPKP